MGKDHKEHFEAFWNCFCDILVLGRYSFWDLKPQSVLITLYLDLHIAVRKYFLFQDECKICFLPFEYPTQLVFPLV